MQENPDGNYYLAKDITIKGNLNLFPNYYDYDTKVQHEECFTGSLDGRGHTIKNYTGMGLFNNAKNATFKNIVMTNVTIQGKENGSSPDIGWKSAGFPISQYPEKRQSVVPELSIAQNPVILPIVPVKSMQILK